MHENWICLRTWGGIITSRLLQSFLFKSLMYSKHFYAILPNQICWLLKIVMLARHMMRKYLWFKPSVFCWGSLAGTLAGLTVGVSPPPSLALVTSIEFNKSNFLVLLTELINLSPLYPSLQRQFPRLLVQISSVEPLASQLQAEIKFN